MKIATLSIGDEVIFGEIVDTNAPFIASRLYDIGLKVRQHLAVGDVEGDIIEAIRTLAATNEAVIATGGLGPTIDDLTARAAAKATDRRLALNETALTHLKEFLAKRGRTLDPANEKQALLPAKSSLIPNPAGTACGFYFQYNGCIFYFLPGVPKEMARMVDESIIPLLRERCTQEKIIRVKVLKVFGVPEAQLDTMLKRVTEPGSPVAVAFQVDFPQILVKLRAEGDNEMHTVAALDEVCQKSREILHRHIFAEDDETMDSVVAALFREKGLTLSLAESCSGGLVAKRITDIPGSSTYFLEGAVTYSNAAKMRILGVSAATSGGEGSGQLRGCHGHGPGDAQACRQRHRPGGYRCCGSGRRHFGEAGRHGIYRFGRAFQLSGKKLPVQRQSGGNQGHHLVHGHGLAAALSPDS